ncbi:MAG: hypothetical protein FJX75_04455 [Armatimonadetes bacterium]|nr:hypothetical protein [Armatimonadota bacterium]
MTRITRFALTGLFAVVCLGIAPAWAQVAESLDEVSDDVELIRQLNQYGLSPDQLKGLSAIVHDVDARRKALADYKHSEAALGPMRALREALLKGEAADAEEEAVQAVWDKLQELDSAVEDAMAEAGKKIAALLTDDQLAALNPAEDLAYEQADEVFANLETAREFNDDTYNAWRDRTAREAGFRAAGESEQKGKEIQAKITQFLDKVRKLKAEAFQEQSDELFDELATILAEAKPKPIREIAEARAAEQLEYLARSERTAAVVEALLKARGG